MYELVTTKFGERLQEEKVVSKFGERLVALFHNRTLESAWERNL